MKKLIVLTLIPILCSASSEVTYKPLSLKELTASSSLKNPETKEGKTKEEVLEFAHTLGADVRMIVVQQYLAEQGYLKVPCISDPESSTYIKSVLSEEETMFFGEGDEEGHYRPTRYSQNPFLEEVDQQFGYVYQEEKQLWQPHYLKDQVSDKQLQSHTFFQGRFLIVGPTKQGLYGAIGHDNRVNICTFKSANSTNLKKRYLNCIKGDQGAVLCSSGWCGKENWEDYEDDQPTALTMDEQTGYFYGGTESGKLHCYSWYTNVSNRNRVEWTAATFPVSLDGKVDDIEVSADGSFLWVLSSNSLYSYMIKDNKLQLQLAIPMIPSEDVVDETRESICVLRRTPDEHKVLLGGTQGTVLLVDTKTGHCYTLTTFEETEPIADMWWQDNKVVLFNRAGKLRRGTVALADVDTFFPQKEEEE